MPDRDHVLVFEQSRRSLLGLAYRILGSRADAEDAVQDTFIKWQSADKAAIETPAAWLTTTCTRRCIDLLRSAHRTRVDYVGSWLPEPIHTPIEHEADMAMSLDSSLSTAFLLMLERLTPKERAAYLLHEIFDMSYPDIATTLDIQEATCRKLVSRARANIDQSKVRHVTPLDRQDQLLAAFQATLSGGSMDDFAALLSDDIELCVDSGGKVPSLQRVLHGKAEVLAFVAQLREWWSSYQRVEADINGGRGLILRHDSFPTASVSFAYDEDGAVTDVYIMRNPDKLVGLSDAVEGEGIS
jgi:RNA polymerase sigma factor (sigma-70 family)